MVSPRPFNFSAGPATLPEPVLQQAAAEMLDWHGCGMGVMEMSHRGKEFAAIFEAAERDLRELLAVPAHFRILFMQGGVAEMSRRAQARAELLYGYLDDNGGFYANRVAAQARSRMNVPFYLADERLNEPFLAGAREAGLLQLKGHKSVGGMRASIYNAMPLAGVQALVDHMKDFARRHG